MIFGCHRTRLTSTVHRSARTRLWSRAECLRQVWKSPHSDLARNTHERISFLWNDASPARLNSLASCVIPSGFSREESALKGIRFHARTRRPFLNACLFVEERRFSAA